MAKLAKLSEKRLIVLILAIYGVSLGFSIFFSPVTDFNLFYAWVTRAHALPWGEFYSGGYSGVAGEWSYRFENTDRFPTDALIFQFLAQILNFFPVELWEPVVFTEIQIVVWVFELLMVAVLILVLRKLLPERKDNLSRTLLILLLPPVWIIATWGITFEFVPAFFALLGFYLLLHERWYTHLFGGAAFALALLERPHFAFLVLPLMVIPYIRAKNVKHLWLTVLGGCAAGLALLSSFNLGLFWQGSKGSLLDLFSYNAVFYDNLTTAAASFWSLWPDSTTTPHEAVTVLGLSVMTWSYLALAVTFILGLYVFLRVQDKSFGLIWFFALLGQAAFFFLPRMLERYNFSAIVLLFLLWLLYENSETKRLLAWISTISFLNILVVEVNEWLFWRAGVPVEDNAFVVEMSYRVLALANALVFYLFWKAVKPQLEKRKLADSGLTGSYEN